MTRNFAREAVQGSLDKKLDVPKIFYGWLGNNDDVVEVPGRLNYVYVTMSDGMVTQAYNVIVPNILNLPVICGYDQNQLSSGLLKVISVRNVPRQTVTTTPTTNTLVAHHKSHEWMSNDGGTDIAYIELRQFMPLRPSVIEPYFININRGVINLGGTWRYIRSQNFDLSEFIPEAPDYGLSGSAVQGRYVLVSLDSTSGSPAVTSGSLVPITTISLSDIPATPAGHYPICAVYTYYYQEKIAESRTKTDLIDLRYGMFDNSNSLSVLPHNSLSGLQGGTTGSYLHLTSAQHTIATQASGSGQAGYLTSADWVKFSKPISQAPVPDFYLTGYDSVSGSFSSGSVAPSSGVSGSYIEDAPIDGDYYARSSGSWVSFVSGSSGVENLDDLLDVNAASPADGQALVWDDGTSKWIPGTVAGGSQVVPIAHTPVENFYLTGYDNVSGSFSSGSVVGGTSGSGGGATTFLGLTDTPSSYSGQAEKIVRVNSAGTGLEFVEVATLCALGFFLFDCVIVSDVDYPL